MPLLYSDAKGAKVLVHTNRLTNSDEAFERFARRIAERGQFLLNVMTSNSFGKNGSAIETIRKVCLVHAAIRHFASEDWNAWQNGVPINQEDMALTLLTFSVSLPDGLGQLAVDEDADLSEAYYERWKAIGILFGVEQEMIPESIDEGRLLFNIILERNAGISKEGQLLTKALIDFAKNSIPGKIMDIGPEVHISYFIGEELSNDLGIRSTSGCLSLGIPSILRSVFNLGEKLEGNSQKINQVADILSSKLTHAMVNYFDTYKRRKFEIPEEFKSAWDLNRELN